MDEGEYETTVVKEWNNTRPTVHDQAHPVVIVARRLSTTPSSPTSRWVLTMHRTLSGSTWVFDAGL